MGLFRRKAWALGLSSALMIVSGYYGELVVTGDLSPRWKCWGLSMLFFLYIVYELLVGLSAATNAEADPVIAGKIKTAQVMTVISWCTYPVVYLFPMFGIEAATAVVSIQMGYCASDIISKCGVGRHLPDLICQIQQGGLASVNWRACRVSSRQCKHALIFVQQQPEHFFPQVRFSSSVSS